MGNWTKNSSPPATVNNSNNNQEGKKSKEEIAEKVKEITALLAKTVSLIKIFPPDHSSVKSFIHELAEKMIKFLEENWKLELDVDEFSFSYQGKTVYQDESFIKSLPFLFFKDGLQKLFFYKGLNYNQLQEFLGLIKKYYESPPGESDIVSLLWEKDFAHIRYFAPDDFLETKIGAGKKPIEFKIEHHQLETGSIALTPEDREELKKLASPVETEAKTVSLEEKAQEEMEIKRLESEEFYSSLSEKENKKLKYMLESNRQLSSEEEVAFLILEILSLEDDIQRFSANLEALENTLKQIIQQGNFSLASQIMSYIYELRQDLQFQDKQRVNLLNGFFQNRKNKQSLDLVKDALKKCYITDFRPVFDYLKYLGSEAILFLGQLYGELKNPRFQKDALNFLRVVANKNWEKLIKIADEDKPALAQEVIAILCSSGEKKAIQLLAHFIPYQNRAIKQAAIQALGKIKESTASKILIGFLADKEEDIRIAAAENIVSPPDDFLLKPVLNIIKHKSFKKRSRREKQTLLNLLARSRNKLALKTIKEIITKTGFFSFHKRVENSLCALKALEQETVDKTTVIDILHRGAKSRHRQVKRLALNMLEKMSFPSFDQKKSQG